LGTLLVLSVVMTDCLETPNLSHFSVDDYDSIYEPAEDSFLLLDALEEDIHVLKKLKPTICLEIGCGSGVVSTCLSKYFGSSCHVMASDVNPYACEATLKTASCNKTQVSFWIFLNCFTLKISLQSLLWK